MTLLHRPERSWIRAAKSWRCCFLAATVLGGGTLNGTCAIRTRSALIDGSRSFLLQQVLNPANLPLDQITGGSASDGG